MNELDPTICRKARLSRDPRFDGEFFLGVTTTGIYCRPVCPARTPREDNVRYFRSAAAAASEGFRPCLRCRPETAPNSPAWLGTSTTVRRALELIREGYLNDSTNAQLAARLGVGERYLRKLFEQELGAPPGTVAQTQRLHLAQSLLFETDMPITDIAFASGFRSVRRFNSASRAAFGCPPGELRRKRARRQPSGGITLQLGYREPYDWAGVIDFFRRHATDGIESVTGDAYSTHLQTPRGTAAITVRPHGERPCLKLQLELDDYADMMAVVSRVRSMFDLDAPPRDIAATLGRDSRLQPLVDLWPGIRSPVVASPFESAVRAVLGQQISVEAARKLCSRLASLANHRRGGRLLFPTPQQLLALPDDAFPMPSRRRQCLRAVCEVFLRQEADDPSTLLASIAALPGVGHWTTSLLAMRGFGDPDSFPHSDLGLVKAAGFAGNNPARSLRSASEEWRPWRSYAANLLWRKLCHDNA